jgi:hypothetical protein
MSKITHIAMILIMNGLVPWALYSFLSEHMTSLTALSIATLVPLADNVIYLCKNRKLDAFGGLMLFTFVLTIALVMMGGSEKLLLLRESLVTVSVGLIFLVSLLFSRPLMFHLAMRFTVGNTAQAKTAFIEKWNNAYFRRVMKMMSAVWGSVFLLEAAVRTFLVYTLTTSQFLIVSNMVLYGFVGFLIVWTMVYRRHAGRRLIQTL